MFLQVSSLNSLDFHFEIYVSLAVLQKSCHVIKFQVPVLKYSHVFIPMFLLSLSSFRHLLITLRCSWTYLSYLHWAYDVINQQKYFLKRHSILVFIHVVCVFVMRHWYLELDWYGCSWYRYLFLSLLYGCLNLCLLLSCFIRLYCFHILYNSGFQGFNPICYCYQVIRVCGGGRLANRCSCWQLRLLALWPLVGVLVWAPLWFWRPGWEAWLIGKADEGRKLTLVVSNQLGFSFWLHVVLEFKGGWSGW